ncbi:MAG TPA: acetate kinase [Acholeplasmataceae bacterium]|nr:acetate kinase [Acholeplasmataceae bacterium]
MLKIMAVNAGSSSLKFKLYEMPNEFVITEGVVERIGKEDAYYTIKVNGEKVKQVLPIKDHAVAVKVLLDDLVDKGIVKDLNEINGVGHRVVQGGSYFKDSALIDQEVIDKIDEMSSLAPLHNPANLTGINAFMKVLPNVPHVAVFDTSFHQTMEKEAYMYALPYEWFEKYKIRKYGFHGTSHKYVSLKAAEVLGKKPEEVNLITCHIGNGASIAAIKEGKCVDTSMGLTPLEGIPMGTRSGDIDPAIIEMMCRTENLTASEVIDILNKKSGYLGVSGISNDSRDLEKAMNEGNERAKLALDLQYKRIADYIGAYFLTLGRLDAIVFTAGIGENSAHTRKEILNRVKALGVEVDTDANENGKGIRDISTKDSKVKAFVIPTDEEIMIARDTVRLGKLQ